ncbi:MAG: ABC transporter permease [Myxococcales bacterium]|nr:ABC transporter permease [Myxococcales bacterium]
MTEHAASPGYWRSVWREFRRRRLAMAGLGVVGMLFAVAILAPALANDRPVLARLDGRWYAPALIDHRDLRGRDLAPGALTLGPGDRAWWPPVPYSPTWFDLDVQLAPPSAAHWLGTDDRGRDVLARVIHGARVSLWVGFIAVGIYISIGVFVGALAGYYGGWVDSLISRIIEVVICFPTFFLIITLVAMLGPSLTNVMVAIGVTSWPGVARLVRGEFLKLRGQDFVAAVRTAGARDRRVIFRHIFPNALAPVLVSATFGVAGAILVESSLSFLGFGVPPPTPSWGDILSQARAYIDIAWWLATFPGLAIFTTITAYNLVGEGLRDATDPRLRGR